MCSQSAQSNFDLKISFRTASIYFFNKLKKQEHFYSSLFLVFNFPSIFYLLSFSFQLSIFNFPSPFSLFPFPFSLLSSIFYLLSSIFLLSVFSFQFSTILFPSIILSFIFYLLFSIFYLSVFSFQFSTSLSPFPFSLFPYPSYLPSSIFNLQSFIIHLF